MISGTSSRNTESFTGIGLKKCYGYTVQKTQKYKKKYIKVR